jgi:hypothetical protein
MKAFALVALVALVAVGPAPALAEDGPSGGYGTLARTDGVGKPYALTAEDALWAARMVVGEAGGDDDVDSAAVLWCMINSYMLRPLRDDYPTFTAFVRAYCTPLQPYLKSEGAIERHRKRGTPMVEVEPGKFQLKRHVELQERPWSKLPAGARALVERVFKGEQPSVCGNATQFCSTATYFQDKNGRKPGDAELVEYTEEYAKGKSWTWFRVEGSNARSNCFFVEKRFEKLPAGVVAVRKR